MAKTSGAAKPAPQRLRAAIYTRISDDPKLTALGVERQDVSCRKLADAIEADVITLFEDNDLTAAKPDKVVRPQFEAMLDAIKRGEFDVIIYAHYDRLLRTRKDFDRLVEVALAGGLKRAIGVRSGEIDLSTAAGQMMGAILASLGHYEVQHMVERMQDAARQRAEAGKAWTPCRWFGYTMPKPDGTGIKKNRAEAALLRRAYEDVLAGRELMAIAREWNTKGVKTVRGNTWKATVLREILLNARNAGIREYKGERVADGLWPAIVTEDVYLGVKAKLSDPSRIRKPHMGYGRRYLLSGIARCGACGKTVGSTRPGNTKRPSYTCRHCGKIVRSIADVDEWVISLVVERLSRPDAVDLLVNRNRPDLAELRARAAALRARQDEVAAQLTDLNIPVAKVKASAADIAAQLAEIERKMLDANNTRAFDGLIGVADVRARFDALDLDRRRTVISALLTVTILPGQPPRGAFRTDLVPVRWKDGTL